jgi:hypothetical protein
MDGAFFGLGLARATFGLGIVLLPVTTLVGAVVGNASNYPLPAYEDSDPLALKKAGIAAMSNVVAAAGNDLDQLIVGELVRSLREAGIENAVIERPPPGGSKCSYSSAACEEQLRRHSADAALHVTLLRLGFEPGPYPRDLAVIATVKVSTTSDRSTLARTYTYRSADLKLENWTADGSSALRQTLGYAWSLLADQVTEDLLLNAPAHAAPNQDGACGLSSIPAVPGGSNAADQIWTSYTLHPTLAWAALDAGGTADVGPVTESTFENGPRVTYDLRIWRSDGAGSNPWPLYSRSGLVQSEHKVEATLEPGATYAWSVRARVLESNHWVVATRWSSIVGPGDEEEKARSQGTVSTKKQPARCMRSLIIDERYFRFVTHFGSQP